MLPVTQGGGVNQAEQFFIRLKPEVNVGGFPGSFARTTLQLDFQDFVEPGRRCKPPLDQQASGSICVMSGGGGAKRWASWVSGADGFDLQNVTLRQLEFKDLDLSRLVVVGFSDAEAVVVDFTRAASHASAPNRKPIEKPAKRVVGLCGGLLRADRADQRDTRPGLARRAPHAVRPGEAWPTTTGASPPAPRDADSILEGILEELGLSPDEVFMVDLASSSMAFGDEVGSRGLQAEFFAALRDDMVAVAGVVGDELGEEGIQEEESVSDSASEPGAHQADGAERPDCDMGAKVRDQVGANSECLHYLGKLVPIYGAGTPPPGMG